MQSTWPEFDTGEVHTFFVDFANYPLAYDDACNFHRVLNDYEECSETKLFIRARTNRILHYSNVEKDFSWSRIELKLIHKQEAEHFGRLLEHSVMFFGFGAVTSPHSHPEAWNLKRMKTLKMDFHGSKTASRMAGNFSQNVHESILEHERALDHFVRKHSHYLEVISDTDRNMSSFTIYFERLKPEEADEADRLFDSSGKRFQRRVQKLLSATA